MLFREGFVKNESIEENKVCYNGNTVNKGKRGSLWDLKKYSNC